MHILQPKNSKLKQQEVKALLEKLNISLTQLPKIKKDDKALPIDANIGEVISIERKNTDGKKTAYFRVVVP
jgi:DNA-directed RNA polymerase subunit H